MKLHIHNILHQNPPTLDQQFLTPPPPPRSDWHGLCLFVVINSCVLSANRELILGFFVSLIFQFYPPPPDLPFIVTDDGVEEGAQYAEIARQDLDQTDDDVSSPESSPRQVGGGGALLLFYLGLHFGSKKD